MKNKTKEQLAEEYANFFRFKTNDLGWLENHKQDFISGWDARQPEIDRLEKTLNTVRVFLIAVKKGEFIIFPNESEIDYLQILENELNHE